MDEAAPPKSLTVEVSKKQMLTWLVVGSMVVLLGLSLELYIYDHLARQFEGFQVINGWFLIPLGGLAMLTGVSGLFFGVTILTVDSYGLQSPKWKLDIPWEQICGYRVFSWAGVKFILVSVSDIEAVSGAMTARSKFKNLRNNFSDNEVPISLGGGKYNIDEVLATIQSYIPEDENKTTG